MGKMFYLLCSNFTHQVEANQIQPLHSAVAAPRLLPHHKFMTFEGCSWSTFVIQLFHPCTKSQMPNHAAALFLSFSSHISPIVSEPCKDLDFLVTRFLLAHSWPLRFTFFVVFTALYSFSELSFFHLFTLSLQFCTGKHD